MKYLLLLGLFCCFLPDAPAQHYLPVARHFGIEDGLPHRQVNCIMQDRRGFIWIATKGGVARFDGLRFKIFNKAENGLRNDAIQCILEDATGNLWLISPIEGGFSNIGIASVDVLDPISGHITPLEQYIKEKPPVLLENLHAIGNSFSEHSPSPHTNTLYFGTLNPGGWVSWHPDAGWKQVVVPSIPSLEVLYVSDQNSVLGIIPEYNLRDTLVELDAYGNILRRFQGSAGNRFARMLGGGHSRKEVFAVEINPAGGPFIYWKIKSGGDKTRLTVPVLRSSFVIQRLLVELENEGLWLNETEIVNQKGEILLDLQAQFPAFNNIVVPEYFRDRNGSIWLGTNFGLELIYIRKDHFRRFLFDKNAIAGRGIACRGLLQKGRYLWVNTEDPQGGQQRIDLLTGQVRMEEPTGACYGLSFDAAGNCWTAKSMQRTNQMVVAQFDPVSGQILDTANLKAVLSWVIFPISSKQLWMGTLGEGLVLCNPETRQSSEPDIHHFPELKKASVIHIGRDHSGTIWLCASTGFYKMTSDGQIAGRYWSGGKGDNWLPYDNFFHFYEDLEGIFWLSTGGGGLLRWNPKTDEKQLISRNAGLLNSVIYAVYEDDFGHLWLPTDYGIAQFDKKALTVRRTWLPSDGVAQNEFNRISHFRGEDGTLYFGGLNGVTAFHPKDFYESAPSGQQTQKNTGAEFQSERKNLVLCEFKLFSGSSEKLENRTTHLLASGEITIQPSDRYFQLEFALLDYFLSNKITYSYKIEGVDADWTILSEPLLRLSSPPYGTYRLKIRAQSADGIWAENELNYTLTVLRPIYLRWWFLLLLALAIAAGSIYIYRLLLHQHQAEKEARRLQELDTFKTRFFANISHEFRTPLTMLIGPAENALKRWPEMRTDDLRGILHTVRRNGYRLLNLVNQLLDLSRLEAGKLRLSPANGDLVAFLRYQVESCHSYAETRHIQMRFESELPELPMAFDPEKIQTILVNLLSNALKFTSEGGSIQVQLTLEPEKLPNASCSIVVTDTGSGIPAQELGKIFDRFYQVDNSMTRPGEGTGIGLAMVQELVNLMQGTVAVESAVGVGTTFRIRLPYTPPQKQWQAFTPALADSAIPLSSLLAPLPSTGPEVAGGMLTDASLLVDRTSLLPHLLIIEDNPDVVEYLKTCLAGSYQLDVAYNGKTGIEKALETIPDLIISDVMMPEKDGYQVCETLKNDERTSHIPIVLLTAKVDMTSKIAGLRHGADAYLPKPFHLEELLVQLEMLVERQKRMVAHFSKNAAGEPSVKIPEPPEAYEVEDAFLQKVRQIIEEHLSDEDFALPNLCEKLNMSRSQLFRKMKALADVSPSDLIRMHRLQKAKSLLDTGGLPVSEVAWQVGYKDVSHFSKSFQEMYGLSPSGINK